MSDDRKSGIAFLAGSLGCIVTMAIHPIGRGIMTPAQAEGLARMSEIAHALAMVSFLILFLGALGVTRRLESRDARPAPRRYAVAALVLYSFAAVAMMLATAVSGFIEPELIRRMVNDAANAQQWRLIIEAVFTFNQAFARIYSVAASGAILLWSAAALRDGGLNRGSAAYGCLAAIAVTILIAVGHLRLNLHGMAVVVFAQTLWFVLAGVEMLRSSGGHAEDAAAS
ncbi:hypothetical protein DYQ86_25130 [Acidobacteria bacterium AB60]|nr:hypothetical protein DYQ86_25130 [Acidobacteria bacterium AB60]